MTNKIATILSEIQIPNNKWYSSSNGLKTRKEEIDPLLISLDNLRRQIKTVEKELKKQLELRKEKHNYSCPNPIYHLINKILVYIISDV